MRASRYLGLALIGLAAALLAAWWVRSPGYMDADYYFATAQQLQQGEGFREPFLWNYLDDPQGLPHPSHLYWMPLTSILAAGAMAILGDGFRAAQMPFILLTAALPVLTASIAYRLTLNPRWAWQSGLLAAFPGFFLPFFVTTDAFSLYAMLGTLALWTMALASQRCRPLLWFIAGVMAGLGGLARADGLLLLGPGFLAVVRSERGRRRGFLSLLLGYALVFSPWWIRNMAETGTPLGAGAMRSLWILEYDELFSYPVSGLTFSRWWSAGLQAHAADWVTALGVNLQRLLAENGLVFLAPFMVIGAVRFWHERRVVRLAAAYLGLLLAVMTLLFPSIGPRGALFHSSTAVLPMLWALAPPGLHHAVHWLGQRRGWNIRSAQRVFGVGALLLAGSLTLGLLWRRAATPDLKDTAWGMGSRTYEAIGGWMDAHRILSEIVAANNPPGFFVATGRPSVVIPFGGPEALMGVSARYGVRWVVLDANHPQGLGPLYEDPDSLAWLDPIAEFQDPQGRPVWLFEILPGSKP